MRRILILRAIALILSCILTCSAASAFVRGGYITNVVSCPQGTALPDGCPGAPSGTIQFPHLLDVQTVVAVQVNLGTSPTDGTYTLTASGCSGSGFQGSVIVSGGAVSGQPTVVTQGSGYTCRPTITPPAGLGSGAVATTSVYQVRPNWNVAGVDYYAGIPGGTVLKDPSTSPPTGATYSTSPVNTLRVNSNNVTINGYDFTLHGCISLLISANVTGTIVKNSKFNAAGASCINSGGPLIGFATPFDSSDLTMLNNELTGTATGGIVGANNTGTFTFEYNYCHDVAQHCVDLGVGAAQSANSTMKYNLVVNTGINVGAHGEFSFVCGGAYIQVQSYNMAMNQWGPIQGSSAVLAQEADPSCSGSAINSGSDFSNNVALAQGIYADTGNNNGSAINAASMWATANTGAPATMTMQNNYLDYTGALVAIKGANTSGITYGGNLNISTGNSCTLATCN